jgi:hypothetical protein
LFKTAAFMDRFSEKTIDIDTDLVMITSNCINMSLKREGSQTLEGPTINSIGLPDHMLFLGRAWELCLP